MRRLSHSALVGFAAVSALLCAIAILDDGHVPFSIFFFLTLVGFGLFSFIGTNFNALAMDPLGHVAGTGVLRGQLAADGRGRRARRHHRPGL